MSNLSLQTNRVLSASFGGKNEGKKRTRNRYEKPTALPCNAGTRCSTASTIVWIFVGYILVFHIYSVVYPSGMSEHLQLRLNLYPSQLSLEIADTEENFKIPPPKKRRGQHVLKPKWWSKWRHPVVNEFLNEKSQLRQMFFPGRKTTIDPRNMTEDDQFYYRPGKIWLDTDGNPIQAHGGGILFDERSGKYYWYGENKDGPTYHAHKKGTARVDVIGVSCYSSKDLWTWKNEGVVLSALATNEVHDLHKSKVLERPKVVYNERTHKYVMWMHIDNCNYTKAAVGVATSDSPTGPFTYLGSKRPHGFDSRDMTIFKDDDDSRTSYLVYSSENNSVIHIGPLTQDYLDVTKVMSRVLVGQHREAPALFKHQGTYYMITSGCSGWAPNQAMAHAAESMMGPWEMIGNPSIGGNKVYRLSTFFSQGSFVIPIPGLDGGFIFVADRWNPADLRDSRYVWLPLIVRGPVDRPLEHIFGFPMWSRASTYWHRKWRLPRESINRQYPHKSMASSLFPLFV